MSWACITAVIRFNYEYKSNELLLHKEKKPKKINVFTVPHAFSGDTLSDKFLFYQRRYFPFSCHQTINNVVSMDLASV